MPNSVNSNLPGAESNRHTLAELLLIYRFVFICTALALVAIFAYDHLPERSLRVLPEMAQTHHIFYDGQNDGTTQAEWVNESDFHFACTVYPKGIQWNYCGIQVQAGEGTQGLNLEIFDRLIASVEYSGKAERLRFFVRDFDQKLSALNVQDSYKSSDALVQAKELGQEISIYRHEWKVSDYWITTNNIPREDSFAAFDNVIAFGVDIHPPIPVGRHEVKVNYLEFRGKLFSEADWYLGTAAFWLVTIFIYMGKNLFVFSRRISQDTRRLQSLASYTDSLKNESQKYKELSTIDALTGALNRNGLNAFLTESCPNNTLPINTALMIVDLDHFKRINDKKGHETGDKVLSSVCASIKNTIRTKDLFVRWGGEEFVLICPDTDPQGTPLVAEKIRSAVANLTLDHNGTSFKVSVSVGAVVSSTGETFDELFRRADNALYQAKNLGRNCVVMA